ncbi:MAG: TolC family protein [Mariprofundales bacterium]
MSTRIRFLRVKISLFANIIILLIATPVAANELTLAEAVHAALVHQPTLIAASARVDIASANRDATRGHHYPRLDVVTGVQRTDSPLGAFGSLLQQRSITAADFAANRLNHPGYITNYQSQASIVLPLYHGGALTAADAQANHHLLASEQQRLTLQQQVIARVIRTFIAIKESQAQQRANRLALDAATQRLHDVQQLQQQGIALESDVMDAKAQLLQRRFAITHSRNKLARGHDRLRQLTASTAATIRGDIAFKAIEISLKKWQQRAATQRHDLLALQAQRQAQAAQQRQAKANFLPNIDLMAAQQWNNSALGLKNRNSTFGATMSLNLFAGGSDRAKLHANAARMAALDADIAALRQSIRLQVADRWRDLEEAGLQQKNADQVAEQRRESLRIRALRHQQGLEKSSDLLRAQATNDQAQVAAIHARYGLLQAQSALYLAAGALTPEVIQ